MTDWELQFHGTSTTYLLIALLVAISLRLLGVGLYHVRYRRWRMGWLAMAGIGTPLMLAGALLLDAGIRHYRKDTKGRHRSVMGAAIALFACVVAAGFIALAGRAPSAIWLTIVASQLLTLIAMLYLPLVTRVGFRSMLSLTSLRTLAILALLLTLFKPALAVFGPEEHTLPRIAIILDASGSMGVRDDRPTPRFQRSLATLTRQRNRLAKHYEIEYFSVAREFRSAASLDAISLLAPPHDGDNATNIAGSLRWLAQEDIPAILISDGRDTTGTSLGPIASRLSKPLHTVGVGSLAEPVGKANAGLLNVSSPLNAADGDRITLDGTVFMDKLARSPVEVRLVDEDTGETLDTQTFWSNAEQDAQSFAFEWEAHSLPAEGDSPATALRMLAIDIPALEGEQTTDDNRWPVHVVITHPSLRVLYVEGVVRPEFKWLRRLLSAQTDMKCVTMVRVDTNRFWMQGQTTLTGLPASTDDLNDFDVVILGDIPRGLWTDAQLDALDAFVRNGGGLIALAGQHSLSDPRYADTGLERLLPVTLSSGGDQDLTPFVPRLTPEGETHPIFRGLVPFAMDTTPPTPELTGSVVLQALKPGATVLAVNPKLAGSEGPAPVLVVQNYGAGRSAAFAADTTWRWQLAGVEMAGGRLYDSFWLQTIRWLGAQGPAAREPAPAIAMAIRPPHANSGDEITLLAQAIDEAGGDLSDLLARCEVVTPDGATRETFTLQASHRGAFNGSFTADLAGTWTITTSLFDSPDAERPLASDAMTLHIHEPVTEMERVAQDVEQLEMLARETGGEYTSLPGLPDLVDRLLGRGDLTPVEASVKMTPIYHFPALFVVFVVAITVEWVLRRRWQLS